jgi:ribonuclease PH
MKKRRDGRGPSELRAKELRCGQLSKFDGSVHYSQGATTVIVTVNGPLAARPDQELFYEAALEVCVSRTHGVVTAGGASKTLAEEERRALSQTDAELSAAIVDCARSTILLGQFPRSLIQINLVIVADDGSLLAVSLNAVMCCLLDAAIPCRTTFAAVSVSATIADPSTAMLMLDTTSAEESEDPMSEKQDCVYIGTFVFALPQSGGGIMASKLRRIGCHQQCLSSSHIAAMTALAEQAAAVTFDFFTNCCSIAPTNASAEALE